MVYDYKNLEVFQLAFSFAEKIYDITETFPDDEKFCLTNQLRRGCISIFSNIAEGSGRRTSNEFRQFLYQSRGSAKEVEALILFSRKREYIKDEDTFLEVIEMIDHIGKMLMKLIKKIDK